MLDQVALACANSLRVSQELAHHVELVKARPDLLPLFAPGFVVLFFDDLRVVFEDVGQAVAGQEAFPQVVGLEAVWVGRITRAVVPALVEGQEPGCLALELGTETHLVVVHGEMCHTASKLEQLFARVAVALVLLDGVFDRLLGQAVLQLESGDWQTVHEQAEVKRQLGFVAAVAELAGD